MEPEDWNEMSLNDRVEWLRHAFHEMRWRRGEALEDLVQRVDDLTRHVLTLLQSGRA